jgi:hypothetical protein
MGVVRGAGGRVEVDETTGRASRIVRISERLED